MGRSVAVLTLVLSILCNEAIKVRTGLKKRNFGKADLDAARASRKLHKKIKSKEEVMASMTMKEAYDLFKKINSTKTNEHLVDLVDANINHGKKVAATREAVDRGRDLLNGIMDETTNKKELELVRCNEFEHKQLTILLELEQDIAYANSEASGARSEILVSEASIQLNEEEKIPNTKEQLRQHNEQCNTELGTLRQQLYIVKNDTEVMKNILSMLCNTTDESTSFLQLMARQKTSTIVKCTSCLTGRQLAWLRHDRIRPLMAQLQSDDAKRYVREHLLAAFDEAATAEPTSVKTTALTQQEKSHEIHSPTGVQMQGIATPPVEQETGACNEMLRGDNGTLYRGCQKETSKGVPCQRWSSQSPRNHTETPESDPDAGLDENFCRNPGGLKSTIWCYTSFGEAEWDFCEPKPFVEAPLAATKHVCVESGSCKMSGASCVRLRDRFMVILAGFIDQRNKLQDDIETLEGECSEVRHIYEYSISAAEAQIKEEQANLAKATKRMTENLQQSQLSNTQHADLNVEYHDEMSKCCDNRNDFTNEICALKKIRGELYRIEGMISGISDCEVTDWTDAECSKPCAGGTQKRTRTIMVHSVNGTKCPPLRLDRACNTQGCPVDCKLDDWSEWSECTALCGGGVKQRSRERLIEADNDGEPCPEQSETEQCNVDACNIDCTLDDWSDWGLCSKACEGGHETRVRRIKDEVKGQGKCKGPEHPTRMNFKECNKFDCSEIINSWWRPLLWCVSMIDLVILVDGSASLGEYGWDMLKQTTERMLTAMVGNSTGVNVAVMVFGGPRTAVDLEACTSSNPDVAPDIVNQCGIHWVQRLTTDMTQAQASVSEMTWADTTTLTSMAILEAKAELINGRQDANSVVMVITDGQPMSPIRTGIASRAMRDAGRLVWVPVGLKGKVDNFKTWASKPWQDSVVEVDTLAELYTPWTVNNMIATVCPMVE